MAVIRVAVNFFSAGWDGVLVGIGALKHLDESHAELKSMHTAAVHKGGVRTICAIRGLHGQPLQHLHDDQPRAPSRNCSCLSDWSHRNP